MLSPGRKPNLACDSMIRFATPVSRKECNSSMTPLEIDCKALTIEDVIAVARGGRQVGLGHAAMGAMQRSRDVVERITERGEIVYGVTTGFGKFADRIIPAHALEELQRNLVLSHSVGVGE